MWKASFSGTVKLIKWCILFIKSTGSALHIFSLGYWVVNTGNTLKIWRMCKKGSYTDLNLR